MTTGIHILLFIAPYLGSELNSRRNEEDPHYRFSWWKAYQRSGYDYHVQKQPDFFHGGTTPYRLLGKPPVQPRPYGRCEAVQLYMVFRYEILYQSCIALRFTPQPLHAQRGGRGTFKVVHFKNAISMFSLDAKVKFWKGHSCDVLIRFS